MAVPKQPSGAPIILVCDDEALIVMLANDALDEAGFNVLAAENASDAFTLLEVHPEIALVVTDVDMPGALNGADLARLAIARRPDLPVVLTSGKPPLVALPPGATFLPKPYRLDDLVAHVAARLARG
jgi:DNA-binding NtrC family response regulator